MEIIPFGKNIYVSPVLKDQVLVSDTEIRCNYGKVISVGDEVKNVVIGDIIGYEPFGVKHLEVNGVDNFLIPEDSDFLICKLLGL